jgi:hypothetical protein
VSAGGKGFADMKLWISSRAVLATITAVSVAGCQHGGQLAEAVPAGSTPSSGCVAVSSVTSGPGKAWLEQQGWRFANAQEAEAAYRRLVEEASPWPDWYSPQEVVLQPGTRFQMALGSTQPTTEPGGFGTFDFIDEVSDVREGLAVREEWKPDVARVVIYEVIAPLPAKIGPVGAQVDPGTCRLLWGRLSQLEMAVPREDRMKYLKVIEERSIPTKE